MPKEGTYNSREYGDNDLYTKGTDLLETTDRDFIYVPENINGKDIKAVIYYPGAGGFNNDDVALREYIGNNADKIVIILKNSSGKINNDETPQDARIAITEQLDIIQKNNNITITGIDVIGHSRGTSSAVNMASHLNSNGYHTNNLVVAGSGFLMTNLDMTDENADNFKEHKTNILIFDEYKIGTDQTGVDVLYLKKLTDRGINVGFICNNESNTEENYEYRHAANKLDTFRNGLLTFLDGNIFKMGNNRQFPYKFYLYNGENWKETTEEEFCLSFPRDVSHSKVLGMYLDKKNDYLKSLSSLTIFPKNDNKIYVNSTDVVNAINGILQNIGNTDFLGNVRSTLNYINESNEILVLESTLIAEHFNTTSELLNKIANEAQTIVSIARSIEKLDIKLQESANDIIKK